MNKLTLLALVAIVGVALVHAEEAKEVEVVGPAIAVEEDGKVITGPRKAGAKKALGEGKRTFPILKFGKGPRPDGEGKKFVKPVKGEGKAGEGKDKKGPHGHKKGEFKHKTRGERKEGDKKEEEEKAEEKQEEAPAAAQ